MFHPRPTLVACTALIVGSSASAAGFSTDIELVRPTFSPRSTAGVDSPFIGGEGRLDLGAQLQFERDPLRLIEFDEVAGAVVRNRVMTQFGVSWAASNRVSLRGTLPIATQWASETEDLSGDGFGLGDPSVGLRYLLSDQNGLTLTAHGDVTLSIGSRVKYMGETQPRTYFGLLGAYEYGPALVMSNIGVQTRTKTDTEKDFELGNELVWNSALVVQTPVEGLAATGEILSRFGMANLFQGGAETSMEWTAGVQYDLNERFRLDVAAGRGITSGYGTSSYRGIVSVRYQRTPPPPPPEEPDFVVDVLDIPDDLLEEEPPVDLPDPEPTGEWRTGELARRLADRIEIRDPIQFEFATAKILPESLPTLRQVANLINTDGRIGHLLIEGHASEEGSYTYNYDLSIRRAKAIFEQLIVLQTHPERMSYRGMGEVVPVADGSDEASLEKNRRVEFEIIQQYQPGDEVPQYTRDIKWPWSGEPGTATQPPPLPPPKRKPSDLLQEGGSGSSTPPPVKPPATVEPMPAPAPAPPTTPAPDPAPAPAPEPTAPTKAKTAPVAPATPAPADTDPDKPAIDPDDPFGTNKEND